MKDREKNTLEVIEATKLSIADGEIKKPVLYLVPILCNIARSLAAKAGPSQEKNNFPKLGTVTTFFVLKLL